MLTPAPRIAQFEKMGFGMFIHWGLYSQLGVGEWTFHLHKRKMEDYKKLMDTFTAEDFDAEDIVLTAKNAGCKYITLTTRHHEGFSLYDTCGLNDFDAPHSPAKRDLVREFVDACNKHGIVPFFYHTTLDWYNKDFENDFDAYLEYLRKSVEILCTNYGKVGGLWFDGNWSKPDADWKLDELYGTIRKHQPEAMIINNTGLDARGCIGHPEIDSVTFEQGRPTPMDRSKMDKYITAEMCYTMNDHWGIGHTDLNYKPPKELIECLCDCRKVGANYLLNVGPGPQGEIVPMQKAIMGLIGRWMEIFGEAIYEGKPYETKSMGKYFMLKGDKCLYIFCYSLSIAGDSNVTTLMGKYTGIYAFSGVKDKIKSIEWMDNGEDLSFTQNGEDLMVNITPMPYGASYCVRVAKAIIE
ncbi:MAG: alpha-L-fucosidase [Clostridiales bacterium]|nr:alpha-L-fucosidase [Clostridiales bacterium]